MTVTPSNDVKIKHDVLQEEHNQSRITQTGKQLALLFLVDLIVILVFLNYIIIKLDRMDRKREKTFVVAK